MHISGLLRDGSLTVPCRICPSPSLLPVFYLAKASTSSPIGQRQPARPFTSTALRGLATFHQTATVSHTLCFKWILFPWSHTTFHGYLSVFYAFMLLHWHLSLDMADSVHVTSVLCEALGPFLLLRSTFYETARGSYTCSPSPLMVDSSLFMDCPPLHRGLTLGVTSTFHLGWER
jgi:hypothetical protein